MIIIYSGLWTFINKIKFSEKKIAKLMLDIVEDYITPKRTLILPAFSDREFLKKKNLI